MTDILMPALSPTMEEGVLAKWHVKVGDTVSAGDVIAEIETDKATMEVEAVDEGTVAKLVVAEGTADVPVNAVIATIFAQTTPEAVVACYHQVTDSLKTTFPDIAGMLKNAEPDLTAFAAMPREHWHKI